ncbi:TPA: HNH endonuclease [Candidatus Poribacteria bacterium]|nr:HNH endonuclease [Candidatus Poribacteria bacterium]
MRKSRVTAKQRRLVVERAQGYCEYCLSQVRFSTQSFSVEHIIPQDKGGKTKVENLALSCQGCNNYKYTKTEGYDPVSHQYVPLYHPRQQQWGDHFAWNDDCTLIIGVTATGRATVETLHLNREGVVNLRRLLYTAKKHPPKS